MARTCLRFRFFECLSLILLSAFAAHDAGAVTPDKLFVEKKCTKCHAVSAYDIEKKKSSKDDSGDEDEDDDKVEPPDLSNVGTFHDAAFLAPFIKKEVEHKAHAGNDNTKKHKVKFKGSDEELKAMVDWLVTLKKAPKA